MKLDLNSLNKYLSPQGLADLNQFIEDMPLRAGYAACIVAGVVWFIAGLSIVYAVTVAQNVAEIRTQLAQAEAQKPVVPSVQQTAINATEIEEFVKRINPLYRDVQISSSNNVITFRSSQGRYFGAWREAINHAYNGGQGWRLSLQSLCVGRECKAGFLSGEFAVNRLVVQRSR